LWKKRGGLNRVFVKTGKGDSTPPFSTGGGDPRMGKASGNPVRKRGSPFANWNEKLIT